MNEHEMGQEDFLYKQVYERLKKDILNGYLQKGDRLPSIRKSVKQFKVSKTSVEHAYAQLQLEGFIISKPQAGYYVDVDQEHVVLRKQVLEQANLHPKKQIIYDFRSQSMDKSNFDMVLWKKYLKDILDSNPELTTYGDAQGEYALRCALQKYAYFNRGVLCKPEDMIIGSSFQSLLYLLCSFFPKNYVIGMETDSFVQAETVFKSFGFPIVYLKRHEEGIDVHELIKNHVIVLYVNTGCSGSTHQPITKKKQNELLSWTKQFNTYIIEDDHNGELRYQTKVMNALQGYDVLQHIFYIGSFSRLLLPSIRISYLVMTKQVQEKYADHAHCFAPTCSKLEQIALAHYISDGHLERHLKKLTKRYEKKSKTMFTLLKQYFPTEEILLEEARLQYVIAFSNPFLSASLLAQLESFGIAINWLDESHLEVSFAAISLHDMEPGIRLLSDYVNQKRGMNNE